MRITAGTRRVVRNSAGNCCEYCHSPEPFSPSSFSIEHIDPRSQGGDDDVKNLALSCQECNNRKYVSTSARDPLSGEIVFLFHPRRNIWSDHFVWNDDFTVLLGLTKTGRATIEKLQLNRKSLVNLRRILHQSRLHPVPE